MRVVVFVKATAESEAEIMPGSDLLEEMGRYNEQLVDAGIMLGLKGFAAAVLGGLGSFPGAIAGGLALGLLEGIGAGYVSSAYKDAIAFVVILAVLFLRPDGLFGALRGERV